MTRPPTPQRHARRIVGALATVGIGILACGALAAPAGATTDARAFPSITVVVTTSGGDLGATIDVVCETPAPASIGDVDLAGAADAARYSLTVPADGMNAFSITDRTDGTACSVTAAGSTAVDLADVDGGTRLVGSDGRVRGVAVAVARGTTAIAHLDYQIPTAAASPTPSATESVATTAVGSGSAASTPPPLPASDGAASAATPVALAAARSTTKMSSAALPDTSGSGTALVLASLGVAVCGIVAYTMLMASRRHGGRGPTGPTTS